jgi:ribosome maturation factor RimP
MGVGGLERIREIAGRVAASEGIELVDVELHGRGPGSVVRIYLDKPGGITLEDCQMVSRQVGTILDVEDVIAARYTLEVSSPGLDRRLIKSDDFQRFAGQQIKLLLRDSAGNRRHLQGRLRGLEEGKVQVEADAAGMMSIPLEQVEKANLIPEIGKIGRLKSRADRKRRS